MPKVSVIIPNYNHGRFLEQRVRSVLDQSFQDLEIIYLDDASTDNSSTVFSQFSGNPRIRSIINTTNGRSVFKQWNKGFREATGDYIWIAESDDYAEPEFLETLVKRLDDNPSVGVAYCQSWMVDENGKRIKIMELDRSHIDEHRWKSDFINNGRDECAQFFVLGTMINNVSSALVRRSVVEQIGYADTDWKIAGDWVFWIKMLLASDIAFVANPLNYWRCHSGTVRSNTEKNGLMVQESYQVIAFITQHLDIPEAYLNKARETWFHNWRCYSEDCRFGFTQNRAIYHIARKVDPAINRRILLYLPIAPVRMILRPIKHKINAILKRKQG